MKIHLLVDWINNNKFFIKTEFEKKNIPIEIVGIPDYDRKDRESKYGSLILYYKYLKLAIRAFQNSSKNDLIICWNFTTSIPVGIINRLFLRKRKIIALNIIAPVRSVIFERIKNLIFNYALNQKNLVITVNSSELIQSYSKRFNLPESVFFVLNDPINEYYKSSEFTKKESYIFSGGEGRRDWDSMLETARITPKLDYVLVARKKYFNINNAIPKNVEMLFDISVDEYYDLFEKSTIIALPLKDKNPAGLIHLIRAAKLSIPVVSTSTPSVRNYIEHNKSGLLIKFGNNPHEFGESLNKLYQDYELQEAFAVELKKSITDNYSQKGYASRLKEIIEELA